MPKLQFRDAIINSQNRNIHYHSDGSGRDYYIKYNEGGFVKTKFITTTLDSSKSLGSLQMNFSLKEGKTPFRDASTGKKIHYYSDNSGRDTYITQSIDGLNFMPYSQKDKLNQFMNGLREYEKVKTGSYLRFINKKIVQKEKETFNQQFQLSKKLSEPRLSGLGIKPNPILSQSLQKRFKLSLKK